MMQEENASNQRKYLLNFLKNDVVKGVSDYYLK